MGRGTQERQSIVVSPPDKLPSYKCGTTKLITSQGRIGTLGTSTTRTKLASLWFGQETGSNDVLMDPGASTLNPRLLMSRSVNCLVVYGVVSGTKHHQFAGAEHQKKTISLPSRPHPPSTVPPGPRPLPRSGSSCPSTTCIHSCTTQPAPGTSWGPLHVGQVDGVVCLKRTGGCEARDEKSPGAKD